MVTLLLAQTAFAAPVGDPFSAVLPDESGLDVFVGYIDPPIPDLGADPPDPDFALDGDVAVSRVKFTGEARTSLLFAFADDRRSVVRMGWHDDLPPGPCKAGEGDLPPGPCTPMDRALPPGPCFQLDLTFDDGSVLGVAVAVQSEGGEIDPGSLVGFNPQPEPPGDFHTAVSFDVAAYARDGAALQVGVAILGEKGALPLR